MAILMLGLPVPVYVVATTLVGWPLRRSWCIHSLMINVTFIDALGATYVVAAQEGSTLMETAIEHEVPGIVGFCGGMCACGTCHCYPTVAWGRRLSPADENEKDTLERVLNRRKSSRLGCQIRLDASLNGLVVELPERQRVP
jgi:2Fe-2S ferredoxin